MITSPSAVQTTYTGSSRMYRLHQKVSTGAFVYRYFFRYITEIQ
jgi:hypothetical protein